jgi:hypothetical protein
LLNSLSKLSFVRDATILSPASLLSGTPSRQKAKGAKGGLLMEIGEFGILSHKDFTSILSMRADDRAEMLAALREIYDGKWVRNVGSDGGKELRWTGKIGIIFGCTESYDDHYGFISALGDRFLLYRLTRSTNAYDMAVKHAGAQTEIMRAELAGAVLGLFVGIGVIDPATSTFSRDTIEEPAALTEAEHARIRETASLAVHLRAHVVRDRYTREIDNIHAPEGEPRIGLALGRLFAGLVLIGIDRTRALDLVTTVAIASTPPIRRRAFEQLREVIKTTREIATAIKLPTKSTRRALEELVAFDLAVRVAVKAKAGETPDTIDPEAEEKGANDPDHWHVSTAWRGWPTRVANMFPGA